MKNRLRLSYKKVSWRPLKTTQIDYKTSRTKYIEFVKAATKAGYNIVKIDEFSVNRNSYPNMSWTGIGESGFVVTDKANERFSVITAISIKGLELLTISKNNTNGNVFAAFVSQLIEQLKSRYHDSYKNNILTCDGARYHFVKEVNSKITDSGLMMIQTVQYTPEFSPV